MAVSELRKLVPLPVSLPHRPKPKPLRVLLHRAGRFEVWDLALVFREEMSDEVDVKRGVVRYEVVTLDDLSKERSDFWEGRRKLHHLRSDPVLFVSFLAHGAVGLEESGEHGTTRRVDDRDLANLRVRVLAQDPSCLRIYDESARIG